MAVLTKIEQQKKNPNRVSLFLDDVFWTGMTKKCFLELDLQKNEFIDDDRKAQIEREALFDNALSYALKRLSYKLLSTEQLKNKMKEKEYNDEVITLVIDYCQKENFINDPYLAEIVASEKREKGYGRRYLQQYLANKFCFDKDLIAEVLNNVFSDNEQDDLPSRALNNKFKGELDRRQQEKAYAFLLRRGFEPDEAQKAITARSLSEEEEIELHGPDEAREAVLRKFGQMPVNGKSKQKAYSFLVRKKFTQSVINKTLAD